MGLRERIRWFEVARETGLPQLIGQLNERLRRLGDALVGLRVRAGTGTTVERTRLRFDDSATVTWTVGENAANDEILVSADAAGGPGTGTTTVYQLVEHGEGPEGPQGPPGPVGPQGPAGANGAVGAAGPALFFLAEDGAEGERGPQGPPGAQGATGSTGPQGPAGVTTFIVLDGEPGADGDIGPMGPRGATGPAGGGGGSATTVEVNLGSTATWRGRFTITDAGISGTSKILCWQAPGPYTGKGTRADEAEMQPVSITAVNPGSGSATAYWETPPLISSITRRHVGGQPASAIIPGNKDASSLAGTTNQRLGKVRGNVKFTYMILS